MGVGILGATGYTGAELVRLLATHPGAALRAVGSRQHAGEPLGQVWPSLAPLELVLDEDPMDPAPWADRGVEVVFAALPHGTFACRAPEYLAAGMRVIDLSADFRLRNPDEYSQRYHVEHPAPQLLDQAVYGLTEWCGPELSGASLVANPGCYATAILLAALPAVAAGWWSGAPIVANALSGVSGAGRAPTSTTHFVECGNSAAPYKVGEIHAHLGEITQVLTQNGRMGTIVMNPHLVPMARGILASIAIPLTKPVDATLAQEIYASRYAGTTFVRLLEGDALPETRHVRGSNGCHIALRVAAEGRLLLVFAAIDNLLKGAAGQAIQNWNRMCGWPEDTGLPLMGWACA
ncbi:MAG TPA: N-acetyl-gamma-glutamyl-phosphate reductase [Candidatus Udaeobacter sp.]|nr:N-acetyl-gamma-glutamyl-phosphate reductase [Candidatus Udaeobacter sp.]